MKSVIVLGMHRSGTSMVSSLVEGLGIDFGSGLIGKTADNPFGYFEDRELVALSDRCLETAGGSWLAPPPAGDVTAAFAKHEAEFDAVVARLRRGGDFGMKDPRVTLYFDALAPKLPDPHLLVCRRDPEAIVRSLRKRGLAEDACRAATTRYRAEADRIAADAEAAGRPVRAFDYDEVVAAPEDAVREVAGLLGLEPSDATVASIAARVRSPEKVARTRARFEFYESLRKTARRSYRRLFKRR